MVSASKCVWSGYGACGLYCSSLTIDEGTTQWNMDVNFALRLQVHLEKHKNKHTSPNLHAWNRQIIHIFSPNSVNQIIVAFKLTPATLNHQACHRFGSKNWLYTHICKAETFDHQLFTHRYVKVHISAFSAVCLMKRNLDLTIIGKTQPAQQVEQVINAVTCFTAHSQMTKCC